MCDTAPMSSPLTPRWPARKCSCSKPTCWAMQNSLETRKLTPQERLERVSSMSWLFVAAEDIWEILEDKWIVILCWSCFLKGSCGWERKPVKCWYMPFTIAICCARWRKVKSWLSQRYSGSGVMEGCAADKGTGWEFLGL